MEPSLQVSALGANPLLTAERYRDVKSQWWNSFKQLSPWNSALRATRQPFATFSDQANDSALFIGWHDLETVTAIMPNRGTMLLGMVHGAIRQR